nr:metallophosphoesterase family protein [uncultured Aminipila sp.]
MEKILKILINFLIILCLVLTSTIIIDDFGIGHQDISNRIRGLVGGSYDTSTVSPIPPTQLCTSISVINNFAKDPTTGRNFTWNTPLSNKTGVFEYCRKEEFQGFDSMNIIKVIAQSYETKTDKDTRMIHKVSLKNLEPGTEYTYRIVYDSGIFSPQETFKTASKGLDPFTFIQITDTQGSNATDYSLWKNTLGKALEKFPGADFLIHTGDMVDDGGKINQWDLFADAANSELMNLPIAPTIGNHEMLNKNGSNPNAKNFTDTFNIPSTINTGAPSGTVYSFDYGNAHIAVMNTECGKENLKAQGDWLISDMSGTDKLWKIVALHRGLYGATYDSSEIRNAWAPIFDQLGIDLVLQGHDHNYVRTYPMKAETIVSAGKGTVYITANSGGVKFYPQKWRSWQAVDLQPYIQMFIAVTVNNNKMVIDAYDVNNVLRNTKTLTK